MENQKLGDVFVSISRERLVKSLLPKLLHCLSLLPEEEIWRRPNGHVNSVGNILLHLCGNVRQWILSGIGGEKDIRKRPEEFRKDISLSKKELKERIQKVVEEADLVLSRFDPVLLMEKRTIQGFDETCMSAIYHAVDHFSYHLGQVIHITKTVLDKDLGFTKLTPEGYNPEKSLEP